MSVPALSPLSSFATKRRVLVVENHRFFRENLVEWIASQDQLECCAEADTVADAQSAYDTCSPDLVLLDLGLDGGNGLDFLQWLNTRSAHPPVIVLSQCDEDRFAPPCLAAGARAFVSKSSATEDLQPAIDTVIHGGCYVSGRGAFGAP